MDMYTYATYAYALCDHHISDIMLEKSLRDSGSWWERTRIYLYRNLFIYLFIYFFIFLFIYLFYKICHTHKHKHD
jgi:hypothetical protein